MKPKILLVVDVKGWALDNIAKEIKKHLSIYYDIDIVYMDMFDYSIVKVLILASDYDLTHFLWRGHITWLEYENTKIQINKLGMEYSKFIDMYVENANITTAVCDHLFLNEQNIEKTKQIINTFKGYIVISQKLYNIYSELSDINKPNMIIQDSVDLNLFKPINIDRFKNDDKKTIKIGWVGNSKFTDSENDDDLKGLRKIIIPALEELKDDGFDIEEKFADRNVKMIEHNDMPKYYNEIDLYICASKTEGTPLPVLEAMACGTPVISTNVGIIPEIFGKKQKQFILEKRDKDCLKQKIKELFNNKKLFKELSEENMCEIKKWGSDKMAAKYKNFFDKILCR